MTLLQIKDELPFVALTVGYAGRIAHVSDVLVDTGSASTIFAADVVRAIGLVPLPDDELRLVRGVGGVEAVFSRTVDHLHIGEQRLESFEIEVGGMDYGFAINGILGMDFLTKAGAVIDLRSQQIDFLN